MYHFPGIFICHYLSTLLLVSTCVWVAIILTKKNKVYRYIVKNKIKKKCLLANLKNILTIQRIFVLNQLTKNASQEFKHSYKIETNEKADSDFFIYIFEHIYLNLANKNCLYNFVFSPFIKFRKKQSRLQPFLIIIKNNVISYKRDKIVSL